MKSNAFTLAEVLITLAIIGIIATITLPMLMSNTSEQTYITALRKGINTLENVNQMSMARYGVGYSNILSADTSTVFDDNGALSQSLYAILMANLNGARGTSLTGKDKTNLSNYAIETIDGMRIMYSTWAFTGAGNPVVVTLDVNGTKGPNILSNCTGDKRSSDFSVSSYGNAVNIKLGGTASAGDCSDRTKRIIRDRYALYLTNEGVYDVSYGAVTWALHK